jgi:hypothetical protein
MRQASILTSGITLHTEVTNTLVSTGTSFAARRRDAGAHRIGFLCAPIGDARYYSPSYKQQ